MSTTINSRTKSVRQLLGNIKYGIDFYQREYEWGRRNIEELLDDLESKFIASFDPVDERPRVQHYPHYFLGTIITVKEGNQNYIVDGQQRLTTLTLLLIAIHHMRGNRQSIADVSPLIFSESYGVKSFNINVPERNDCMKALFDVGAYDATNHHELSVRNLVDRYNDIVELFPETLTDHTLPYFVDWLIDNVDLVEIEAYNDDDAFTIFETMNDRGVNLGPSDMLKGYLLANINSTDDQMVHDKKTQASRIWKQRILELVTIDKEEDISFFKTWFRSKYAESIRERRKGASNRDFENINKFHRWVRDEKNRIGLFTTQDYYEFIVERMNRFASYYLKMRQASSRLTPGLECICYNAHNNFTLQYLLALAPIRLDDDIDTVNRKIRMVASFIDILLARRIVNFKSIDYNAMQYAMFNVMKTIRDLNLFELRNYLLDYLHNMEESFDAVNGFYLHQQNYNKTRHLLARMTAHVEQHSGINTDFDTYIRRNEGLKPFEIEHIWADKYERHVDEFASPDEFNRYRNRFGGLILLRRGTNQSFGADTYEAKLRHYIRENLLVASLSPQCYEKNPNFLNYLEQSGLPFQPHLQFKKGDLESRQALYQAICEEIWNPKRLDEELA